MSAPTVKKVAFPIFGLALTALGSAVGGPEAGLLVGTLASSLTWLGGVFGNRTDAVIFGAPSEPDAEEVFRNHDLRALLCRTIEIVAEDTYHDRRSTLGSATDILKDAGPRLAKAFATELDAPDSPLHTAQENQVPDILSAYAQSEGRSVEVLTEAIWLDFIQRHISDSGSEPWEAERLLLAQRLHTSFATALWNLTKIDANSETGGRAFAAVQLLYFTRILDAVKDKPDAPDLSPLISRIETLIVNLDETQTRWFQRLWQQSQNHHESNMQSHHKTQWLLQLVLKRLEKLSPPPPPAPRSLHQLPPRPQGFVGREADLAILRAQGAGGTVITGLRGMGGIGKTALATVLAHEWSPQFPDAQLLLDGQGTRQASPSGTRLQEQVITTFHPEAKLPDDPATIAGLFHQVLSGKRVLLFLDNAKDSAQAKALLPPSGCGLVVTSRRSIMLGTQKPHDVGRLTEADATALLREFEPQLSAEHAAQLVKLCAGLPLALRLAGAHLAQDGDAPGYIKALSSGRLATLNAEAEDAGEITISETLRLSEAQLQPAEREAWRALGVFESPFDARAAEAIAGASETILQTLNRRSLLERPESGRYRLHDLAADYARAQLSPAALDDLRLRHAQHYTAIGREADGLYEAGQPVPGLALFDAERQQIEAAFAWLSSIALAVPDDPVPAQPADTQKTLRTQLITLVDAIVYTGQSLRFHPRQRITWLEAQAQAARLIGDCAAEGNALGNLGNAHFTLGDAREAIEFYEQHLVIAREIGDRRGEGNALGSLGNAHLALGDARKAIEFYELCLVLHREIGDRRAEGADLGNLGLAHADLGDARKAIEFYEQQLVISREMGDRRGEGNALGNLGNAHADLGDARKAIAFYEQQLVIAREIGDRRGEGNALWNSALAYEQLGDRAQAIYLAKTTLAIREAIEDPNAAMVREAIAEWEAEG